MAKFNAFKFGQAKFGTAGVTPFNPNMTYNGIPLGFIVRRQLNKEFIYRYCQGHQFKYPYFVPTNPQTVPQQAWRTTFTDGVTAAKALNEGEKDVYRDIAKRKKGQTWFSVFMSEYLLS